MPTEAIERAKDTASLINEALSSDFVLETQVKHFIGGITIVPNNICNARCVFCAYPQNEDPKTTMSLDLFKQALDSAFEVGYVGTLQLTPMAGDPLIDPHICEKIEYARSRGVQEIHFNTNGILFGHKELYRRVLDANPTGIGISTPGFDPVRYKKIFGVDKCDQLVESLVKLGDYKKKKGAQCTTSVVVDVAFDWISHDSMELPGWKLLRPFFDDGTFKLSRWDSVAQMLEAHAVEAKRGNSISLLVDNWSESVKQEALPENLVLKQVTHTEKSAPCFRLLDDVAVLPDGKVRVCSCRYTKTTYDELVIGDLKDEPLSRILYGEKHKQLIQSVAKGDWPAVCLSCTLYKPVPYSEQRASFLAVEAHRARRDSLSVKTDPMTSRDQGPAAHGAYAIGRALERAGDIDGAIAEFWAAHSNAAQQLAKDDAQFELKILLARIFYRLALLFLAKGSIVQGLVKIREALRMCRLAYKDNRATAGSIARLQRVFRSLASTHAA